MRYSKQKIFVPWCSHLFNFNPAAVTSELLRLQVEIAYCSLKEFLDSETFNVKAVAVELERITHGEWYEMRREQPEVPLLSVANPRTCSICCEELGHQPAIKCEECERSEVVLCIDCFKLGAQAGEHLRGHNYSILDPIGPQVFADSTTSSGGEYTDEEKGNRWGCYEDLHLLSSFIRSHLDQWPDISRDFGCQRSIGEALRRVDECFLRSSIGNYVLGELKMDSLKLASDESEVSELPATHLQSGDKSADETVESKPFLLPALSLKICNGKWGDQPSSPHSPISDKRMPLIHRATHAFRAAYDPDKPSTSKAAAANGVATMFAFDGYDDDSESTRSSSMERRPTEKKRGRHTSSALARSPLAASEMASSPGRETAISNKHRYTVKRGRKSGSDPPELPISNGLEHEDSEGEEETANEAKGPTLSTDVDLDAEKQAELRTKFPNSYYYDSGRCPLRGSKGTSMPRFDEEDLQLLAFMPKRDEFEHEYKNDAEQLVSNIVSLEESDNVSGEVEQFINEAKLARIRRYNRILKIRETRRNIIREHQLVSEYLSIVKNNLSEKGRYNVLDDVKYFSSKQKDDFFRPLFFQLRQVADRSTIEQLAENIGKMETLKDQIEELLDIQKDGGKVLKGRLKGDTLPGSWLTKKKRLRRVDNLEQRKAGLRWKRIKRWTKKQGTTADETDE